MAKKSKATAEAPSEVNHVKEDATTPENTKEATTVAKAKTETMSKSNAVRAAIADGVTEPKEGVDYIQKKFGIEVTTAAFSVVKSQDKKKADGGAAKKPAKAKANGKPTPPAPTGHDSMGGSPVALLRQVKQLADAHGGDEIREILSLLGK